MIGNFGYSVFLNGGDFHHMDYMWDWWSFSNIGLWWIGVWVTQLVFAILVYRDAKKKDKNDLLWFILVVLPWIGLFFLIGYLVVRNEEVDDEEVFENAQHVIDERYARGEIDRDEYLQMKKDLKNYKN